MKHVLAGLVFAAVVAAPLPQPAGTTRFYTQWELHMRQVYRSDSDINREYGNAGSSGAGDAGTSGALSGSDSGGNGGGTRGDWEVIAYPWLRHLRPRVLSAEWL